MLDSDDSRIVLAAAVAIFNRTGCGKTKHNKAQQTVIVMSDEQAVVLQEMLAEEREDLENFDPQDESENEWAD